MKVDLYAVRERLRNADCQDALQRFLETQSPKSASHSPQRKRADSWRDLQIESDVAHLLHPTTIDRLESDAYDENPLDATDAFDALSRRGATISQALQALRPLATPYDEDFRIGPVSAEAGFTGLVALFPAAEQIMPTLSVLEAFRKEAPLGHSVWNAVFLEIMLLQLHPFQDGNGRTVRAFTDFELWRSGVSDPSIKNIRRTLDANRAHQLMLFTAMHSAASSKEPCSAEICACLKFQVDLRTRASE